MLPGNVQVKEAGFRIALIRNVPVPALDAQTSHVRAHAGTGSYAVLGFHPLPQIVGRASEDT